MLADGEVVGDRGRRPQVRRARPGRQGAGRDPDPAAAPSSGSPRDDKGRWAITQLPQVEVGVRLDARRTDGAILSLVGGFDFERNKFNHVTQAQRQPGSAFKPFIYSAALEKGFTPATIVNDAPFFVPGGAGRRRGLGAEELRRQVRRPDAHAHRARQVEEPRHRARAAGDRAAVRAGLHRALRLRPEAAPAVPDDGAGRGLGDAAADGRRLRGVRQRRLPRRALSHRADRRRQGQRAVRSDARRSRARTPSARSTRAMRGS